MNQNFTQTTAKSDVFSSKATQSIKQSDKHPNKSDVSQIKSIQLRPPLKTLLGTAREISEMLILKSISEKSKAILFELENNDTANAELLERYRFAPKIPALKKTRTGNINIQAKKNQQKQSKPQIVRRQIESKATTPKSTLTTKEQKRLEYEKQYVDNKKFLFENRPYVTILTKEQQIELMVQLDISPNQLYQRVFSSISMNDISVKQRVYLKALREKEKQIEQERLAEKRRLRRKKNDSETDKK